MKFFLTNEDASELRKGREHIFNGEDRDLYFHLGHFNAWYAGAEIRLTLLLAAAVKATDLRAFDILTKGMDARVKLNRLREASLSFKPIGPNLTARFDVFERHLIPLRNRIAHTYAVLERDNEHISFTSLGKIPKRGATPAKEDLISTLELFEAGVWLRLFHNDLKAAAKALAHSETLETDHPQSPLLPKVHRADGHKDRATTPGRKERKRLRKGLPTRGKRGA